MRLATLSSDTMTPEQVGLYRDILSGPRGQGPRAVLLDTGAGGLAGPFNTMLYAPEVGHALQELGAAIRFRTQLSSRIRELAILVVAQAWNSEYERSSHELLGRDAGLTDPGDQGAAGRRRPRLHRRAGAGRLPGRPRPDRPRRPGRPAIRSGRRHPGRTIPGRAVHPGRLLRHPGPPAPHLPRRPPVTPPARHQHPQQPQLVARPDPGIGQPRYLGVGAGTGAVIPPLGFKITLTDQIRPVQIYALVDLGLLSLPRDRT